MTNVQYFDEMNLIQSEKDVRVEMCNTLSGAIKEAIDDENSENWEKVMRDILIAWLLLFGYITAKQGKAIQDLTDSGHLFFDTNSKDWYEKTVANSILFDTENTLKRTIADIEKGTSKKNSKSRADVIARDATNKYSNIYNRKVAKDNGATRHKWISMRDKVTRSSHRDADGQIQPIDIPYNVNGYYMMFPMDDTYGAPADEICNCRCTEIFY